MFDKKVERFMRFVQEVEEFDRNTTSMTDREFKEAIESLKECFERDVIYTGGFRFYGGAVIAEIVCKKCQKECWVNFSHPKPLCVDCDDHHHNLKHCTGRLNEAVLRAERQYHGEGEF